MFVILTTGALATGGTDLGQRGVSTAGSGSELLLSNENKDRCAISETGTGFACAKLSEILPAARVARFVRMTTNPLASSG